MPLLLGKQHVSQRQCNNRMQTTQPDILQDGPTLTREQQLFLIQPFNDIDVKATLMSNGDPNH